MWISRAVLTNVRSFEKADVNFSKGINVLVGANNAGKSTIIHAVGSIQDGRLLSGKDRRIRQKDSSVALTLQGDINKYFGRSGGNVYGYNLINNTQTFAAHSASLITAVEPNNFIYPYLSKRKTAGYNEQVNEQFTNAVQGNFQHLYAKVDRISNPEFLPAHDSYMKACDDILGFRITTVASPNGKKAAYIVRNVENIPLEVMGEGVANIVGLVVDLCIAEDKLFLIEEPENDIHPKALKGLLSLIREKSETNQFIVTTHSHIVTKYLGSNPNSKVFEVKVSFENRIPSSEIEEVASDVESRRRLLESLGYELIDVDMWESWLILEESSAEKIIREYLIPWFLPNLVGKLRTFSARTISELEIKFNDLNNLFVFLNMEPIYKNRVWTIVDSGGKEKEIIDKLKKVYANSGWKEGNFSQFKEHDFEKYYPEVFQEKVNEILQIGNSMHKLEKKKELREEVERWIESDSNRAKQGFEISAKEVIDKLKEIEVELLPT